MIKPKVIKRRNSETDVLVDAKLSSPEKKAIPENIDPTVYRFFKDKNTKMSVFPEYGLYHRPEALGTHSDPYLSNYLV
jgi:hypothetical protein